METERYLYLVIEYASRGEIFGKVFWFSTGLTLGTYCIIPFLNLRYTSKTLHLRSV